MRPSFSLQAGERDITESIGSRLQSLQIIDQYGLLGDELTLILDDSEPTLTLPDPTLTLSVLLGYRETGSKP